MNKLTTGKTSGKVLTVKDLEAAREAFRKGVHQPIVYPEWFIKIMAREEYK